VDTSVLRDETLLFVVESPVLRLEAVVLVEVERLATLLSVVERAVLSEEIPVDAEVLSESRLLFVVDRPVLRLDTAVEVEVDSISTAVFVASNCEPLIASVLVLVTRPAATFVI
jgi:hypothetical protein